MEALATQTAKATEDISAQVVAIRDATGEAVGAVKDVTQAIGQVDEVAAAIGAAVEAQALASREIAESVHKIMQSTNVATEAMRKVSAIAEETETTSQKVVTSADDVGRTADTLRGEVGQFLAAMADSSETERRGYERIAVSDGVATLHVPGRNAVDLAISDISRGGVALSSDWSVPAGTEVRVSFPGVSEALVARVAHAERGVIGLFFRQDRTSSERIDQVLDGIAKRAWAKAA